LTLAAGARLGPYEIVAPLGAGGMGEVYRARDSRLNRDVAIKVLSTALAGDPALRERFTREAHAVAALNHPHICTIHDVGRDGATDYLVMEWLAGETLAARLAKGALPLEQALQVAIQIADALSTAHRAGIVHRDLKPANVMLTARGATLLDFGLAKTDEWAAVPGGLSMRATAPAGLTVHGAILGTLQYMAPEQLEGQQVDGRTDIFAFGALCYEMLTGRKAFEGKSQASLIAAILEHEPPPIAVIQPLTPPALDHVVRRCLGKDPQERWQTASDLTRELKWIAGAQPVTDEHAAVAASKSRTRPVRVVMWVAMAAVGATIALVAVPMLRGPAAISSEMRLEVTPPTQLNNWLAISPDARTLVFTGFAEGTWRLWVRSLDSVTPRPLAGTEGGMYPFWSPDNRSLGFFSEGALKRIDVAGGPAQTLARAPEPRGGAWSVNGRIIFAPAQEGPLSEVSAAGGGTAVPLTRLEPGHTSHRFPTMLPDGRHFLYFAQQHAGAPGVYVSALDGSGGRRVVNSNSLAVYVPGFLLFRRQQMLLAQQFQLETLEVRGEPFAVADSVDAIALGTAALSAATDGTVAFKAANAPRRLIWFDRSGAELTEVAIGPHDSGSGGGLVPELSPDFKRLAVQKTVAVNVDVWLVDIERGVAARVTSDPGADQWPLWSPDGRRVVFSSNRTGNMELYEASSGGSEPEVPLLAMPGTTVATSWSSRNDGILFAQLSAKTGFDLWVLPLTGDRKPYAIANREFDELGGQFSHDGRWVAYETNESGRFEIVVQPFPGPGAKQQISNGGGVAPRWRADGRELFYVGPDRTIIGVPVTVSPNGPTIEAGKPTRLVAGRIVGAPYTGAAKPFYAVTADGQRFLVVVPADETSTPTTVILNWAAGLRP
jgi:eukaryotic-like serine/threonine-protein kinase